MSEALKMSVKRSLRPSGIQKKTDLANNFWMGPDPRTSSARGPARSSRSALLFESSSATGRLLVCLAAGADGFWSRRVLRASRGAGEGTLRNRNRQQRDSADYLPARPKDPSHGTSQAAATGQDADHADRREHDTPCKISSKRRSAQRQKHAVVGGAVVLRPDRGSNRPNLWSNTGHVGSRFRAMATDRAE